MNKTLGTKAAALALRGGRKESSFLCVLESYGQYDPLEKRPQEKDARWFLKALVAIKEEIETSADEAIIKLVHEHQLSQLVVDFPLSWPACHDCQLTCPGEALCPVFEVQAARDYMNQILEKDRKSQEVRPKQYEYDRADSLMVKHNKDVLAKKTEMHLLSKSFKRRLKKGLLPYWNRPLDAWLWCQYYDQLLDLFNITYDSFGQSALMGPVRLSYLRRHWPISINVYESNVYINFVELLKGGVVKQKDLSVLAHYIQGVEGRLDVIKEIEDKLGLFVYGQDLEQLISSSMAFEAFILAVGARQAVLGQTLKAPAWASTHAENFLIPLF